MSMSIFRPVSRYAIPKATPRRKTVGSRFLPSLESMEARLVLSHMAPTAMPTVQVAPSATAGASATASIPITVTGLNINNVVTNAAGTVTSLTGTLTGSLAGQQFTTPLTLTSTPSTSPSTCPVLNLHLGAIHLNLLGLKVDTSPICLNITATSGNGNPLGTLVCDVANLLNNPLPSSGVANLLSTVNTDLSLVPTNTSATSSITGLVDSALSSVLGTLNLGGAGAPAVPGGTHGNCHILHLSVAPVNLDLLGLNVHLDNCHNGPITVKINAIPGQGNLLGNLICDIAGLLNSPPRL